MNYNNNDFEDQNLHIAGEDSFEVSSVLRPYTLPKFDFDDSFHRQLGFDSLVENEAFPRIASQEDNHWINDFSRASNGIEFNSSAAESCSLPSHINVWSEATSSESVEMLLKAVMQEETYPGESLTREANPLTEKGTSTKEMDKSLMKDDINKDSNNGSSSLPPINVEWTVSRPIFNTGVVCNTEDTFGAQVSILSSCEELVGVKDSDLAVLTGSPSIEMKTLSDLGETCAMENESVSNQVNEFFSIRDTLIDNSEYSSHNIVPVAGVERDNTERNCSVSVSSKVNSSEEELGLEMPASVPREAASNDEKGENVSTNEMNVDVTLDTEHFGGVSYGNMILSSAMGAKEVSDTPCVLYENSFITVAGEDGEVIRSSCSGSFTIGGYTELIHAPNVQLLAEEKRCFADEDILHASNSSSESQHSSFMPSRLCEVFGFPTKIDSRKDIKEVDCNIMSKKSTITGECFRKKSTMGVEEDLGDTNSMKEIAVGQNHDVDLLVDGIRQPSAAEIYSRLVDECQHGSGVPEFNREAKNLVIDPLDVVKKDVETSSPINDMKDETVIASNSDTSKDNSDLLNLRHVLDSKIDNRSLASSPNAAELHNGTDAKLKSPETEKKDMGEQTLSQASTPTSASVSVECLKSDNILSHFESEKVPKHDPVVEETRNTGELIYHSETSTFSVPNESRNKHNKNLGPDSGSVAFHECVSSEIENKLDEGIQRDDKKKISSPVGHSMMKQDKIIEATAPDPGFDNFSLVEVDKKTSLQGTNVEVGEVLVNSDPSKVHITAEEGRSYTFNTGHSMPQSTSDFGKDVHFPTIEACKTSLASGGNKTDDLTANVLPNISSPTPGLGCSSADITSYSSRKSRRGSSKSVKGNAKKANKEKEAISARQNEKGNKPSQFVSPLGSGKLMNSDCCVKPRGPLLTPASGLPDLNTSASPSAFFRQPFTDLQQVQLRAQIIVYGSLIQGAAPDEACLISAFDGDRNLWEPSWRACVNRLQVGKSKGIIGGAFIPAIIDAQVPDQARREGFSDVEVLSSVASHARNKGTSPVVNPVIPFSSPLWTMATVSKDSHPSTSTANAVVDYQFVSSLNHYQTPAMRKYAAHSSWSPLAPLPMLAPTQSSPFNLIAHHSRFPITAPVRLSPIRDSSMHIGLGSNHFPSIPTTSAGVPTDVISGPSNDLKNLRFPSEKNSDKKTRKQKKPSYPDDSLLVSVSTPFVDTKPTPVGHQSSKKPLGVEDSGQILFIPQTQVHSRHTIAIGSHYSTSVTVPNHPMEMPKSSTSQFFSVSQPFVSGDTLKRIELAIDKREPNIKGFSNADEAKQQAEEASANAATAVAYCETVWSQMGQQNTSHLNLDSDSKLASAAAAIAAAASVAKAAAISAMIAANVAAKEKRMFEEAINMCQIAKTTEYDTSLVSCPINTVTKASHASIFCGLNNHPTSAIAAAREAARKRVEAASAATRHAENLDALVKAAELAAEAVSHAGKIVAMTDPSSLSKLVEAGPDSYGRNLQQEPLPGSDNCIHGDTQVLPEFKNNRGVPDARIVSRFKEGSHVEVLRDCGDSKKAWFSATVLGLREGEALICYTDILSGEGSQQLKEWVSRESKDNTAPRIRNPHSLSSVPFEKTRKRPRDVVMDYSWSIGDKVDVWMQNCWFEGIISEKNKKDESILSVKFPDQEETTVVKVWNLRPTLIWNGVQWVEASRSESHNTYKGDTPPQKKPKIVSSVSEITEKGKQLEDKDYAEIPRTEGPDLPLSVDEKKISIGSKVEGNKHKVTKETRFGSEKAGSRVVFGIPKPGRKRKFMEVSKHYVSEQQVKSNVCGDSVRLAKLLKPHGPSSQSSKNNLKVETKEKQAYRSKLRGVRSTKQASSKPDQCDETEVGVGECEEEEDKSGDGMMFCSEAIIPELKVPIGKAVRNETEGVEPRRSVRRIQPTSRLLEGLQSSLIISKLPSTSHEKEKGRGGGSGSSGSRVR